MTKCEGPTLRIRVFARDVQLNVPDGAENVIVELPTAHGEPERETVMLTTARDTSYSAFTNSISDPFPIDEPGAVTISLVRLDAVDPFRVALPPPRLQPILRRGAAEGRDRVAAIATSLGLGSRGASQGHPRASG